MSIANCRQHPDEIRCRVIKSYWESLCPQTLLELIRKKWWNLWSLVCILFTGSHLLLRCLCLHVGVWLRVWFIAQVAVSASCLCRFWEAASIAQESCQQREPQFSPCSRHDSTQQQLLHLGVNWLMGLLSCSLSPCSLSNNCCWIYM